MDDIYIVILVTIFLIILFLFFVFYHDIMNFFKNLGNITMKTSPSDCPDYWIKYSNHKDSSDDTSPKSGCYVNATLVPDVVYNGGKCNYLDGERTNFGNMPNYCDRVQVAGAGDDFINNLTTATSGIELVDGWQSFFKGINLPAVISIAPQHNKEWNPGLDGSETAISSNDDSLFLAYVKLYKYETFSPEAQQTAHFKGCTEMTLASTKMYTGPSYTITGIEAIIDANTAKQSILIDNAAIMGGADGYILEADKALTPNLNEFSLNSLKCGENYPAEYNVEGTQIPCPSTWRCEVDNLEVNSKYVLIYIGKFTPSYPSQGYIVSVYDKLTTSYIKKAVSSTAGDIKISSSSSTGVSIFDNLTYNGTTMTKNLLATVDTDAFIGYLTFETPPYNPDTNDPNTVAGYSMDVFENLSLCQKRTWAVKNDIQWSGITDNPTLSENCNESDFFSPVDFDLNFMLTSRECVEYLAEDIIPHCRLPTYKIETNTRVFHFYRKDVIPSIVREPTEASQAHHGYYEVGYVGDLPIKEQADDVGLNLQDLINAIIQDYNYHISNSSTSIFATWQENDAGSSTPLGSNDFNRNAQESGFPDALGGYPNVNLINFIDGYELSFDKQMPGWHNNNDFVKNQDDSVYKSDYDGGVPGYEGGHYLSGTCRSCDPTQMTNVNTNSVITLSNIFDIN